MTTIDITPIERNLLEEAIDIARHKYVAVLNDRRSKIEESSITYNEYRDKIKRLNQLYSKVIKAIDRS